MAKAALSVVLQDASGKAGTVVFKKTKDGPIITPRIRPANPQTPSQIAIRENLRTAATTFKGFTANEVAAWNNYAQTLVKHNRVSGKAYHPTGMNAFTALATKWLQVHGGSGTIPITPPTTGFDGDNIGITATPGTGKVTFTASGPNAAGVVTEFLLQPLASANRKAQKGAYRSKGFFAFVSGTLTHEVTVPPGYYAAAYRFVKSATGQETGIKPLNTNQVTFSVASGSKPQSKKAA